MKLSHDLILSKKFWIIDILFSILQTRKLRPIEKSGLFQIIFIYQIGIKYLFTTFPPPHSRHCVCNGDILISDGKTDVVSKPGPPHKSFLPLSGYLTSTARPSIPFISRPRQISTDTSELQHRRTYTENLSLILVKTNPIFHLISLHHCKCKQHNL